MLTNVSPRYMLTQPDRFDVALLHLDRPVFYQVLFAHLLLISTKYQSINFVSLCDYTFWTRPYLGEKFVAN